MSRYPEVGRQMQRGRAGAVLGLYVGAVLQQNPHDVQVIGDHGVMQRRGPASACRAFTSAPRAAAAPPAPLFPLQAASCSGSAPMAVPGVDVGALLEQRRDRARSPALAAARSGPNCRSAERTERAATACSPLVLEYNLECSQTL